MGEKSVKNPTATIVIPNWNGKHFLKTCLDSLREQVFKDFEVIIVDNGSTDGSLEYIREHYPEVIVVAFPENRGFSAAVNGGIKKARGTYIALLNNDTEVDPLWLAELVKTLDSRSEVGFCASKMLNYYKRTIIDTIGDGFSRYGIAYKKGARRRDGPSYSREEYVFGACAGASIYRRALFEEIGLFDEDFFAYLEDIDISFRAQLRGYRCLYVPTAVVYHMIGGTSGGKGYSLKRMAGKVVNKLFVVVKNMPAKLLLRNLPLVLFAFSVEGLILFCSLFLYPETFKKEFSRLKLLPKMLCKRRKIQRRASNRSIDYVASLLSSDYPLNPFK